MIAAVVADTNATSTTVLRRPGIGLVTLLILRIVSSW